MDIETDISRTQKLSLTEIGELENENEEDSSDIVNLEENIPNYERVLQNLFGKEVANRFVHPKIDESVGVAGMTAGLRSQRTMGVVDRKRYKQNTELSLSKIQTNAERLWSMLRENSSCNIMKEDNRIDPDLKGSFNAFARGFIGRNMTPPQRSFVEDKELTEMRKNMKSKKVAQIELNSRKTHLMYNLSELQAGNQAMLLSDKSFINTEEPGIRELLFPAIEEEALVRSHEQLMTRNHKGYHEMLSDMGVEVINEEALFQDEPKQQFNLKFFNEKDSMRILREKNSFRDNISKKLGHGDNVMEQMLEKCRRWSEDDRARSCEREKHLSDGKGSVRMVKKGLSSGGTEAGVREGKPWQPLTLGAVMDFKVAKKPTFVFDDDGQFRQGACRLWRPKLALV